MQQPSASLSTGRRVRRGWRGVAPLLLALGLLGAAPALAGAYVTGYYSGHTTQGKPITFVVAGGRISELQTEIADRCASGTMAELLHPYAARIDAGGSWYHKAAEQPAQPTIYHGRLGTRRATGTIDDTSDKAGKPCHAHVSFSAGPSSPVRITAATVGAQGTQVRLSVTVPAAFDGGELVPSTALGLLVYGSSLGCRTSYSAAVAQARSGQPVLGLISDTYLSADWSFATVKQHVKDQFRFAISSGTLLPNAGASPYSTVCAMLYRGRPASGTPQANLALQTTSRPLRLLGS